MTQTQTCAIICTMTYIQDLVTDQEITDLIRGGLLNERKNWNESLIVLNYSKLAQVTKGAWDNWALRLLRGMVVDTSDRVLARCLPKFFNREEPLSAPISLTEPVEITDKLDGSLIHVFYNPYTDSMEVASRGSFTSTQAVSARQWLEDNSYVLPVPAHYYKGLTLVCEWISPDNRIVVDYGPYQGLKLLCIIDNRDGYVYSVNSLLSNMVWCGLKTEVLPYTTLAEYLTLPPRDNAEGVVVRSLDTGHMQKIKYDKYVQMHKIIFGLNEVSVWEWRKDNRDVDIEPFLADFPDELHSWIRDVDARLTGSAKAMNDHIHNLFDSLPSSKSRKDFAEAVMSDVETNKYSSFMFALFDNRDIWDMIYKTLKPRGDARPTGSKENIDDE